MTPAQIEAAGKLLFGNEWRYAFADRFTLNTRTLRRLLAGVEEPPEGLVRDVEQAVRDHAGRCDELLESINA